MVSESCESELGSSILSLVDQVVNVLRARGETVSFAESCSGGMLSASFTELPGVSDVFLGAVVAYANSVKVDLLAVQSESLNEFGAVSLSVAKEMALGAQRAMRSDWAVSITGIAGPSGGSEAKPVGTVCFGLAGPSFEDSMIRRFNGDRRDIQGASVQSALCLLLEAIAKVPVA